MGEVVEVGAAGAAVAVILAAGAGRRLGGVAKALLRRPDGVSYLESLANTASAAGVSGCVVVIGEPFAEVTRGEARRLGLEVVVNPAPERGMSSSVEVGFGQAGRGFPGAATGLLWPVDHARVRPDTVRRIIARARPGNIVVPMCAGRGGHPGGFGRDLWPELRRCGSAEQGARTVVHDHPARVVRIDVDDPGVVDDVDRPTDLEC